MTQDCLPLFLVLFLPFRHDAKHRKGEKCANDDVGIAFLEHHRRALVRRLHIDGGQNDENNGDIGNQRGMFLDEIDNTNPLCSF